MPFSIRKACTSLMLLIVFAPWMIAEAGPVVFSDGFEGASLDPFWSTTLTSGYLTMPSTSQVHSGNQSIQFNSTLGGSNKYVFLQHQFASPMYGSVSAWVFDTGADVFSSNALSLQVVNTALNNAAYIVTPDYDLGPGNNGSTYSAGTWSGESSTSTIDRTQAWHHWTIDSTPSLLTMAVDGQTIFSSTTSNFAFDTIVLAMYAPDWRPAFTSYWDDVTVTEFVGSAVPEPSSLTLFGTGLATLLVAGRYRRRNVRQSRLG